jgi:hypothetical protein
MQNNNTWEKEHTWEDTDKIDLEEQAMEGKYGLTV